MKIALLSDIHSNREAFEAVLSAVEAQSVDRIVVLGDIVGYGADPKWCLERCKALAADGAIIIRGNHDQAVDMPDLAMGGLAATAIDYSRRQIEGAQASWLMSLSLTATLEDMLFVHASGNLPSAWTYVVDDKDAEEHFAATGARLSFCGHIHRPALYGRAANGRISAFTPVSSEPIPLASSRRWLCVVGSVGQPRDRNPAAAWCLLDTDRQMLRFMRTAYDIETAAEKIMAAGLPEKLATRLFRGE